MGKNNISKLKKNIFLDVEITITEEFRKSAHHNTYTPKELNNLFSKNGNKSFYIHLSISLPHCHEGPHSLKCNLKAQPKISITYRKQTEKRKAAYLQH